MKFANDKQRRAVFSRLAQENISQQSYDGFAKLNKFSLYYDKDSGRVRSTEYPNVDFLLQSWAKPERTMQVLETVPEEHLAGLRWVEIMPEKAFDERYPKKNFHSFHISEWYEDDEGKLRPIEKAQSPFIGVAYDRIEGAKENLAHEVGHHVLQGAFEEGAPVDMRLHFVQESGAEKYMSDVTGRKPRTRILEPAIEELEFAQALQEARTPSIEELSKYSNFSFDERKRKGWYPTDSNLPYEFDTVVLNATFRVLRDQYGHYHPDDDAEKNAITWLVGKELDKNWEPAWGKRPSDSYIKADVEEALEKLK